MYQTKFKIKIDKKEYEVGYPNVGQQLEIESMKQLLSKNRYAQIGTSGTKAANQLLDFIDAVSYFSILIPSLELKITFENFGTTDIVLQRKLIKAYIKYNNDFIVPLEAEINKELTLDDELEEESIV